MSDPDLVAEAKVLAAEEMAIEMFKVKVRRREGISIVSLFDFGRFTPPPPFLF